MSKLIKIYQALLGKWNAVTQYRFFWPVFIVAGLLFSIAAARLEILDQYVQLILIYVGINIIIKPKFRFRTSNRTSAPAHTGCD